METIPSNTLPSGHGFGHRWKITFRLSRIWAQLCQNKASGMWTNNHSNKTESNTRVEYFRSKYSGSLVFAYWGDIKPICSSREYAVTEDGTAVNITVWISHKSAMVACHWISKPAVNAGKLQFKLCFLSITHQAGLGYLCNFRIHSRILLDAHYTVLYLVLAEVEYLEFSRVWDVQELEMIGSFAKMNGQQAVSYHK